MPATTPVTTRRVPGCASAEAQRVEQRDRPRAHREDVAQDAADAGGRALVGLDERRVVVGLDLEDRGQAVADVHRARVLAGPLQHARPLRGQRLQVDARALVAAVLGPHHREHAELGQVRLAAEDADDAVVLVFLEAVAGEDVWRHGHVDVELSAGVSGLAARRDTTSMTAPTRTRQRPRFMPRSTCRPDEAAHEHSGRCQHVDDVIATRPWLSATDGTASGGAAPIRTAPGRRRCRAPSRRRARGAASGRPRCAPRCRRRRCCSAIRCSWPRR